MEYEDQPTNTPNLIKAWNRQADLFKTFTNKQELNINTTHLSDLGDFISIQTGWAEHDLMRP